MNLLNATYFVLSQLMPQLAIYYSRSGRMIAYRVTKTLIYISLILVCLTPSMGNVNLVIELLVIAESAFIWALIRRMKSKK